MKIKSAVVAMAFLFASQAQAEIKVGLVNMQKALFATAQGKKVKSELDAELEKRNKDLQKKEGDLKKMKEDIEKKRAVLSEDAFSKKSQAFDEEMFKYRDSFTKNQMELQKKQNDLLAPILDKMKKAIEKVAKDQKLNLVLENNQMVLFVEKPLDITDDVVKEFETLK